MSPYTCSGCHSDRQGGFFKKTVTSVTFHSEHPKGLASQCLFLPDLPDALQWLCPVFRFCAHSSEEESALLPPCKPLSAHLPSMLSERCSDKGFYHGVYRTCYAYVTSSPFAEQVLLPLVSNRHAAVSECSVIIYPILWLCALFRRRKRPVLPL